MEIREAGEFVQLIVNAVEGPLMAYGKTVGYWQTEEFVGAFEGIMEAFSIYPELLEEVVWKSLQKEEAE